MRGKLGWGHREMLELRERDRQTEKEGGREREKRRKSERW